MPPKMCIRDREFRAEMAANRKTGKKASGDEFLGKKADDALARYMCIRDRLRAFQRREALSRKRLSGDPRNPFLVLV